MRADYHYSFSVLRCRYKLINLRARFLCIMARSAGTLCCSRIYRRRAPGRPALAYPLASIVVRSCPAAIPVHEYRYVPAHTRYAYLFITYAGATGMPGRRRLYYREAQEHRGYAKCNGPRLRPYIDLEGLGLRAIHGQPRA